MTIAVSTHFILRNNMGQFIAECKEGARATAQELVEEGYELAHGFAPERDGVLKASMGWVMLSATSGVWFARAAHALPQEFGGAPHVIQGNPSLSFYWENEGRWWIPAEAYYHMPGLVDMINHPGNPAQPYLRPAYRIVMAKCLAVADKHYPG